MASLGARGARLLLNLTVKQPLLRALGKPDYVRAVRRSLGGGTLIFGRLPRGVTRTPVDGGGVRGEWLVPAGSDATLVVYYLHGGGYVTCSPSTHRRMIATIAKDAGARAFALDYRLAPEHRFPAALDDALSAYQMLLDSGVRPERIVVGGDSAGGGLTMSLLVALRDAGKPLPAGAFLFSPWVDLAATGASIQENRDSDDLVVNDNGEMTLARAYLGDLPLDYPPASTLYADLRGLPPLLVQASSIEMLRDDAIRLVDRARAAGVDATLQLFDGVPHVWQLFVGIPEARAALASVASFAQRVTV